VQLWPPGVRGVVVGVIEERWRVEVFQSSRRLDAAGLVCSGVGGVGVVHLGSRRCLLLWRCGPNKQALSAVLTPVEDENFELS
jgi:hypothetical protein